VRDGRETTPVTGKPRLNLLKNSLNRQQRGVILTPRLDLMRNTWEGVSSLAFQLHRKGWHAALSTVFLYGVTKGPSS